MEEWSEFKMNGLQCIVKLKDMEFVVNNKNLFRCLPEMTEWNQSELPVHIGIRTTCLPIINIALSYSATGLFLKFYGTSRISKHKETSTLPKQCTTKVHRRTGGKAPHIVDIAASIGGFKLRSL